MVARFLQLLLLEAALLASHALAQEHGRPSLERPSPAVEGRREWRAQWIGVALEGEQSPANQWICFRRDFELERVPERAPTRIAVDSRYWLWVNGELLVSEGGLKRGPNPRDSYCDELDLAPGLRTGTNTIALLLWHYGKSGYSHNSSGRAGLVLEAELGERRLDSDASWSARVHPAYGTAEAPPPPNYRLSEANVRYDARLELGPWMQASAGGDAWPPAIELGRPPCAPWNGLVPRPIPLWRESPARPYVRLERTEQADGSTLVVGRLSGNLSIEPALRLRAPQGLTVDIRTDDYRGGGAPNLRHEYVTREGEQEYAALGYLTGHAVEYRLPPGVELLDASYRELRYDTDVVGSFACDDPFYERLWQKAAETMLLNMHDGIQDPDRERAQWWGDVTVVQGEIFDTCDARGRSLVTKAVRNLFDWQREDGVLYSPVPSGTWRKELPLQSLASVGRYGLARYVLYSGDLALLREVYARLLAYLDLWQVGEDGLVIRRPGDWTWVDWGANKDVPVLYDAWYLLALQGLRDMAAWLGDEPRASAAGERMAALTERFRSVYWSPRGYRSPEHKGASDDRANALAVLAGCVLPAQRAAVLEVLTEERFASPYMEKYVLEALFALGRGGEALARMRERYQPMVESELATLWELWSLESGQSSYNHAWSGGPLVLLSEEVAGIAPLAPGYASYRVRPRLGSLKSVSACVPSVRGPIRLQLRRESGRTRAELSSPPDSEAHWILVPPPAARWAALRVGEELAWSLEQGARKGDGWSAHAERDGSLELVLRPGDWTIEAEER